jgi:hypothetical protein
MSLRQASVAASVALVLLGTSACGDASSDLGSADEIQPDFTANATVDRGSGEIILPIQSYYLRQDEARQVDDARSLAMRGCAVERGLDEPAWRASDPELGGSRLYGVWLLEWVEKFGYEVPTTPRGQALADAELDSEPYTAEQLAVYDACAASDAVLLFSERSAWRDIPIGTVLTELSNIALSSEQARSVFSDWEACLATRGLERVGTEEDPYGIVGASLAITPQNISIATADVTCKDEVDFVQRLADVEAAYQQPVVDRYESELSAQRADFDELVTRARQYLTDNAPTGA